MTRKGTVVFLQEAVPLCFLFYLFYMLCIIVDATMYLVTETTL